MDPEIWIVGVQLYQIYRLNFHKGVGVVSTSDIYGNMMANGLKTVILIEHMDW